MSVFRATAVILCCFSFDLRLCTAQLAFPGSCPANVKAMQDFDAKRYVGTWYEYEKYFFIFELGGKCVITNYGIIDDTTISVTNREINKFTGAPSEINGEATLASITHEGKLAVRFSSLPVKIPAPYWVVDTDYDNYSIVWSCNDFGRFHLRYSWVLTRARNPSPSVIEKVNAALVEHNVNPLYFVKTDQSNCLNI